MDGIRKAAEDYLSCEIPDDIWNLPATKNLPSVRDRWKLWLWPYLYGNNTIWGPHASATKRRGA